MNSFLKKPMLIVVSGMPCSGKTTLAVNIGKELNVPYFSKDKIKEIIFDNCITTDRNLSLLISQSAFPLLLDSAKALLIVGQSVIVESNFKPDYDSKTFLKIQKEFNCHIAQIHCDGDRDLIIRRFAERAISGKRHSGHSEKNNLNQFIENLREIGDTSLALDTPMLQINTTENSESENLNNAIIFLRKMIGTLLDHSSEFGV